MNEREELELTNIIRAARTIQDFLWGEQNKGFGLEEWRRMLRKRMVKIEAIDSSNPYAITELKKRLLQIAALVVGLLAILSQKGMLPNHKQDEPVSNLPEYEKKP